MSDERPPSGDRRRRRRRRGGRASEAPRPDEPQAAGEGRGKRRRKRPSERPGRDQGSPEGRRARAPAPAGRAGTEDDERDTDARQRWGDDADAPEPSAPPPPALPADPPADDPDPASAHLEDDAEGDASAADTRSVVGVKFARAGKIYLYDGGDDRFAPGEEVVVEAERGGRLGVVAVGSVRQPAPRSSLKRILRRPNASDRRTALDGDALAAEGLRVARERARALGLAIKLFRAESSFRGNKLTLYFSSEDKVDTRPLARALADELPGRVELRQIGVRDQAKLVGGIGSCGMELCCSTWLPAFVPVSIKNAKDQGLVLNPSKVSGQCGRLKCCLVYEQETYAAMRKGLPKLGKRVVTERGDGRVVEVDVLHQRIRVNHGQGDVRVYPAGDVKPMFPPQQPGRPGKRRRKDGGEEPSGSNH